MADNITTKKIQDVTPMTSLADSALIPVSVKDGNARCVTLDTLANAVAPKAAAIVEASDYEDVTIQLSTEDEQGSVAGVSVEVKVEGEASARSLTTDADGKCTTRINHGLEYDVDCADIEGYHSIDTIKRRSALPSRIIPVTYIIDDTGNYEHCKITVVYTDETLGTATSVTVAYTDGTTREIAIVNNVVEFDVPMGTSYSVVFPDIDGYRTPATLNYTATHLQREHRSQYIVMDSSFSWLMKDGAEKAVNQISVEDKANVIGLRIATSDLLIHQASFVIPLEYLIRETGILTKQWCSSQVQFTNMGLYGSESLALTDYIGKTNTTHMLEFCEEKGLTSAAASYVRSVKYTVGGAEIACDLPAYAQLKAIVNNYSAINEICLDVFGETMLTIKSGYWWSSTQYNANNACIVSNGSFGNYSKPNSYQALPILAY